MILALHKVQRHNYWTFVAFDGCSAEESEQHDLILISHHASANARA